MKRSEPESSINKAYLLTQELWLATEPLLPVEKPKPKGGRPRGDAQQLFNAMFYVLRTGIQWKALPSQLGAASTAHDRYQEWVKAGVFEELWHLGLMQNQVEGQLDWEWQSIDSASSKAPLGENPSELIPRIEEKGGTKRHIITEAHGLPIALTVTGANVHDKKQVEPLLDSMPFLPLCRMKKTHSTFVPTKGMIMQTFVRLSFYFFYQDHIKARGEEQKELKTPGYRARRWVCERTHSWMNRFRRILIRWEKKVDNYLAFLHLACAHIVWKNCTLADPF